MKAFAPSLLLVLFLAGSAAAGATPINLVLNPDFAPTSQPPAGSNNSFNGPTYAYAPTNVPNWSFSTPVSGLGGAGVTENGGAWNFSTPPDGAAQEAFLQMDSTLSQDVTGLTVGYTYMLSLYAEQRPASGGLPMVVSMDGVTIATITPASRSIWTYYSAPFVATANSETLMFTTNENSTDLSNGISDAAIILPTPEPSSLLLFVSGLLGLPFFAMRRSRRLKDLI